MSHQIPRDFIDQVLDKVDVVDLIGSVLSLKKFGANYKACCPFHDEKTPSFVVSPAKQIYHCFGCGVGGNAISFVMEHDHLNFVEALKELAHRAHLTIPTSVTQGLPFQATDPLYTMMQLATQFYQHHLKNDDRAKTYLIKRGLSGVIAKQFGIGYAPNAWDALIHELKEHQFTIDDMQKAGLVTQSTKIYDKFRDRIIFPIHDRKGRVIAFGGRVLDQGEPKYLNSPETAIFHKSNELYGLFQCLQSKAYDQSIIVVEGYMDVLALVQQGISNVVGTLGTATTEQHLHLLFRYTDNIVFCFDGDDAGKKAGWRALTVALPQLKSNKTLSFIFLPDDEDPDTFVRQHGREGFLKSMQQSISLSEFFVKHLAQGLNLNIADHRAKFLHQANQLLQGMADAELQHVLAQEVAQRIRMPISELMPMIRKSPSHSRPMPRLPQSVMPSNLRKIMTIILQHPGQAHNVTSLVNELSNRYDLLKELVLFIQENQIVATSELLEYFRDSEHWKSFVALAAQPLLITEEGLVHELQGALEKIVAEERREKMEALMLKAQKASLTEEEKRLLYDWLKTR